MIPIDLGASEDRPARGRRGNLADDEPSGLQATPAYSSAVAEHLRVPGLEILGPIGSGGMGEVYMARQDALGRLVAVKWLRLEDVRGDDRCLLDRFRREATLMARVHHPNVLTIHDFGVADGRPYLVMEYVAGGDLRRLMSGGKPVPLETTRTILRSVCGAVARLHREGILHRDLKPENILLADDEVPKVADFGIAVFRDAVGALTRTASGLGTPGYVAPEQQCGHDVDERADQYSLAALTYEMLTGQKPLGAFEPPSAHHPGVSKAADAAILRALSEKPCDRFASVAEFGEALGRALADEPRAEPPAKRPGWLKPVAACALVLGAIAVLGTVVARLPRGGAIDPGGAIAVQPGAPGGNPPGVGDAAANRDAGAEDEEEVPVAVPVDESKLIELQAYLLWLEQGSPEDETGAITAENMRKGEELVGSTLNDMAYEIWVDRGSIVTGVTEKDDRESLRNWEEAKRRLRNRLEQRIGEVSAAREEEKPERARDPAGPGDSARDVTAHETP